MKTPPPRSPFSPANHWSPRFLRTRFHRFSLRDPSYMKSNPVSPYFTSIILCATPRIAFFPGLGPFLSLEDCGTAKTYAPPVYPSLLQAGLNCQAFFRGPLPPPNLLFSGRLVMTFLCFPLELSPSVLSLTNTPFHGFFRFLLQERLETLPLCSTCS